MTCHKHRAVVDSLTSPTLVGPFFFIKWALSASKYLGKGSLE